MRHAGIDKAPLMGDRPGTKLNLCLNVNLGEVWSWLDISSRVGARGLTPSSLVL